MPKFFNAHISDLYFNRDLSDARDGDDPYANRDYMLQEAQSTIDSLKGLGVTDLPTADELVEDFFDRL